MNPWFSAYLDIVRFVAALAVFFDHLSSEPFTKGVFWRPVGKYGAVAVTIFFVLSGYVIAYVTANRERTAALFFASRAARLYSVVLVALPLTFVLDSAGMHFNPPFYAISKVLWKPESWAGYLSSSFFLNEYQVFRFKGIVPGTNAPYWSLSFEATYYVLAGLTLFCKRTYWIAASAVIIFLAGRTIAALLPIWVLGFLLYRKRSAWEPTFEVAVGMCACSTLLLVATPLLAHTLPADNFGLWLPWGRGWGNRNLLQDYIAAVAFAAHLVSVRSLLSSQATALCAVRRLFGWLGSLTFPLYCLHFPVICLLAAVSPWSNTSWSNAVYIGVSTIGFVIIVTPLCDSLKSRIRRILLTNWRDRSPDLAHKPLATESVVTSRGSPL